MEEIWKVYKDTTYMKDGRKNGRLNSGVYEVSNKGNVRINGVLKEPLISTNGYLYIGGFNIHRAVAELFVSNPDNKSYVDHINANKLDNSAENLRWVTAKENVNNPITKERRIKSHNTIEYIIKSKKIGLKESKIRSERMKLWHQTHENPMKGKPSPMRGQIGATAGKHRVYHEDGTFHYEK